MKLERVLFENFFRGLLAYHNVTGITNATVEEWFLACRDMDSEFFTWAGGVLRREEWPRGGFPTLLRRRYQDWLRMNQSRQAGQDEDASRKAGCSECLDGYVFMVETEGDRTYTSVARCAVCRPEEPASYPYQNSAYLRRVGRLHRIHDLGAWDRETGIKKFQAAARGLGLGADLPF